MRASSDVSILVAGYYQAGNAINNSAAKLAG